MAGWDAISLPPVRTPLGRERERERAVVSARSHREEAGVIGLNGLSRSS
jgi:hypothetical protein